MAAEQFNSLGGFSVGIPPVQVIDKNGNIIIDVNALSIIGGENGFVLQTDGAGNLTWTAQIGGDPGNGSPGGANAQVQFNDAGVFGGNAGFTFNSVTGNLSVPNFVVANIAVANVVGLGNIALLNLDGNSSNVLYGNGVFAEAAEIELTGDGGNISNITGANVTGFVANSNVANTALSLDSEVSVVKIQGGANGFVLQTDGTGNLSWEPQTGQSLVADTRDGTISLTTQYLIFGTRFGSTVYSKNPDRRSFEVRDFIAISIVDSSFEVETRDSGNIEVFIN